MAKDLPSSISSTVLEGPVTRPGYLVYLGFDSPLRLCSWDDVSYDGHTWSRADVEIKSFKTDDKGQQNISLVLGNNNYEISAIVLSEGVNGKVIKVWAVYFDSSGSATDPYGLFSGKGDGCDLSKMTSVTINAATVGAATWFSPRKRICESSGFHYLPSPGTVIKWGDTTLVLE